MCSGPRWRDRLANSDPASKVRFTIEHIAEMGARSVSLEALLPFCILKANFQKQAISRGAWPAILGGQKRAQPVAQRDIAPDRRPGRQK